MNALLLSQAVAAANDIRDIQAPLPVAPPWWHFWQVWAAVGLVVLGLVWWFFARKRAQRLTPWERAELALQRARAFAENGQTHAWAETVATVVREALAERLGERILHLTTAELHDVVLAQDTNNQSAHSSSADSASPPSEQASEANQVRPLLSILEACDLARFAKAPLTKESLLEQTDDAEKLTRVLLKPKPASASHRPLVTSNLPVPS